MPATLLALFLLQTEFSLSTAAVAGVVAAIGGYGANRFFLGGLSAAVKDHGRRLEFLEKDAKECAEDRGYIRGRIDGGVD